jgi:hypothetical protein
LHQFLNIFFFEALVMSAACFIFFTAAWIRIKYDWLPFNFILFQVMFHSNCVMKWHCDIQIFYEHNTGNWLHSVSWLWCVWLKPYKGNILSQLQYKG